MGKMSGKETEVVEESNIVKEIDSNENKRTPGKNVKADVNKKAEKTPTKITEVEDAEEIIEDMQRIQDLHKSEEYSPPAKGESNESRKKTSPVKTKRSKELSDIEQQMMEDDASVSFTSKIVPSPNVLHPSETKISQSTSKKLVNKYKQSQSSIVKRLGIVSVFSSRRKRNCRTENDDVMRKTKKKIKLANKPKMKVDTSIGNIISNTASMETESINENIEMELDFEKEESNKKSTLKQLKTVPMNEETEVSKRTLSNLPYKSDDNYNIKAKQIVKPKKIEKPEFVPILSRRLARRNFKAKLTPGQKILKRVISKSANSKSASRTLFSNQIEKQINPILEKMNQEYDQSKMIANLKSTKTEKVSMSSKSSNNSDTQPKYRKGELDFLDAAIVSRRHGRKCTVKDNLKEEKFKKPVVLKPKVKRDTSANAEDLSSLIQFAKERRTSSSSTTSTSSEISITSKIRIIESMEDRTSFNSRASDSRKSSHSIKKVSKNQPTIAESKKKSDLEESVDKPASSNKGKKVGVL